jgi:formylglycine-generating enzyme required for sulfatase activity
VKHYRDFDLLIERSGQGYTVRVLDSPAGNGDTTRIRRSVATEIGRRVERLVQAFQGGEPADVARPLAEELGAALYRAAFAASVGRRFEICLHEAAGRETGLRLRLRLTDVPELSCWPWEYLFHHRFLALSAETPIIRFAEVGERFRPLRAALPLTVLVVIAAPADPLQVSADREWGLIEQALAPLDRRVRLEPLRTATLSALEERLRRDPVHVLHFIGHGGFDAANREGALLFDDPRRRPSRVTGERLGALLLDHPTLRLVVLNACEGARHGEADAFCGVAQRLLQQRIPAVVAMQREVSNRAAVTFAERFYASLADGDPVEAAVAQARRAMDHEGHGVEWGAPVLYLRSPDGVLFDLGVGEAPGAVTASDVASETAADGAAISSPLRVRARHLLPWAPVVLAALLAGGLALLLHGDHGRIATTSVQPPASAPLAVAPSQGTEDAVPLRGAAPLGSSSLAPDGQAPAPAPPVPRRPPVVPRSPACPSPDHPDILFVPIPKGTFEMGSSHGGKPNERPVHQVTINHDFCLGAYEITVAQWDAVMGDGLTPTTREEVMPKVGVTWDQARLFVERLNARNSRRLFFLPSEAQWEYAARAGSAAKYSFGDDPSDLHLYANCIGKEGHEGGFNGVAPIGKFQPNEWRLYDMQGNVSEWVADFYAADYDAAPAVDPRGPPSGDRRVARGGSFRSSAESCGVAHRVGLTPNFHRKDLGFRIAATPVK